MHEAVECFSSTREWLHLRRRWLFGYVILELCRTLRLQNKSVVISYIGENSRTGIIIGSVILLWCKKKPALVVYFEYMCMCVNCAVSQPIFTSKVENRKTVLAPSAEPLHTLNLLTTIPTWQKLICCSHCIHPNFLSFIESLFLSNSAIDIIVKSTDYYTHF